MKVLMLNGSSHAKGCTFTALEEIGKTLNQNGIEYEIFQIGAKPVRDCIACGRCSDKGCVFDDDRVNEFVEKAKDCQGFIFGSPVYYAHPSGSVMSFLDRAFYSSSKVFRGKVGASVASARRAGTTATLDVLNKYFTINCMPVVSSTYWNMVHGACSDDVKKDLEGLQIMRNLGTNMAWLLKCIEKADIEKPEMESGNRTNFIR